jgi:hypothetical protein
VADGWIWSFLYSVWPLIEQDNNSLILGILTTSDFDGAEISRNIKQAQFYTAFSDSCSTKENVKYVQKHNLKL